MNHALLPAKNSASLPAKYEAAKVALRECNRIDECKDWADKAQALASYAKQADDKEMERVAQRIRARAIRRCGQLLKEIEKGRGGQPSHKTNSTGGGTPTSRKTAAAQAGMSKDQAVQSIRVANVSDSDFDAQVDSDNPPTITSLAEQGMAKGIPRYEQLGMTKKAWQAGMYFRGAIRDFAKRTKDFDPQDVVDGSTEIEREQIRRDIETIDKYLDQLIGKL